MSTTIRIDDDNGGRTADRVKVYDPQVAGPAVILDVQRTSQDGAVVRSRMAAALTADEAAAIASALLRESGAIAPRDVRSLPHGWAILVRYAGPTNHRGSRWIATADHPIGRAVTSYDHSLDTGAENARTAADALVARWAADYAARYPDAGAYPHRIASYGHLPSGDYAFIVA